MPHHFNSFGSYGPRFDPSQVADLVRWYRPEGLAGYADDDPIDTWPDESSVNADATQLLTARPTKKDSIINGLPVARFDGLNDYFNIGDLSSLTEGEVFMVVRVNVDPPEAGAQSGIWHLGTSGDASHYPFTDGNIYDSFGSTVRKTVGDPTPALSSWRIVNVHSASNDWAFKIDGVTIFSTGTNTVSFPSSALLGRCDPLPGNVFLDGDIAEYIQCSRKLVNGERANIASYLQSKFAL
jgi:hypothetical protein